MNEEMKVRSFRISDSVLEKFKAFCNDFDNQNLALDSLINAYEVQNAKAILVDRQTDIADYDMHIQALQSAFLRSLELNENAERRIRAEFKSLLSSKDEIILQLQSEKTQAQNQSEQDKNAYNTLRQTTNERIKAMQEEVTESKIALQNANERADIERKAREQAETISLMLSEQVEQLKKQIANLTAKVEQAEQKQAEQTSSEISKELINLRSMYAQMQKELTDERTSKEKELVIAEKGKETAVKVAIAETKEQYLFPKNSSIKKVNQSKDIVKSTFLNRILKNVENFFS